MARPLKEINWDEVIKRMEAGISAAVIADNLFIDHNTFYRRFKDEFGFGFADYAAKAHVGGKSNIIYTQYLKALDGNTHMLTLLGKEWCGQGKDTDNKVSPNELLLSMSQEIMELKYELAKHKENGNQSQAGQELLRSDAPL